MQILLVGNYALDQQLSMLRYADSLYSQMLRRGHRVELICPQPVFGHLVKHPVVRKWLGYIDKYLVFPVVLRARSRGFDLVHVCDHSNSVYLPHTGGRPASITCHDLIAIASAQGRYADLTISATGKMQQRWIRKHLIRARNVVCVSRCTADELAEQAGPDGRNIVVIPNAVGLAGGPATQESIDGLRARLGLAPGEQYFFHVGGNGWYKNRLGVLRIYRALRAALHDSGAGRFRLVMAGQPLAAEMRELIKENGLEADVIEVPRPSDDDLRVLYSGASALLFPSLYEGFGLPIIEAQSCGCPVISSNRAPMTEVGGDSVLYVDPGDEAGAAAHIAGNLNCLPRLREAGFRNVVRFDPDLIAAQYDGFFADVARRHRSRASEFRRAEHIEGNRENL